MKSIKKRISVLLFLLALFCLGAGLAFWYVPVPLLSQREAACAASITVFNGATGQRFEIDDADAVASIASELCELDAQRERYERTDGFTYSLTFYDKAGKPLESLILNGAREARKGNITYQTRSELSAFSKIAQWEAAAP